MSVSAQPRMVETDKPCRGRNSAAEASDGHGRQEQERVTAAARREDRSGTRLVSEPTGPGEGQRQMAQPHTCSPPGMFQRHVPLPGLTHPAVLPQKLGLIYQFTHRRGCVGVDMP